MTTTVNEYALLYNSEVSEKSKQIIIKQIKDELYELTRKIVAIWIYKYIKPCEDKKYYFEEFMQIADEILLLSLDIYNYNRGTNFKDLYITCFKNELYDYNKNKHKKVNPEVSYPRDEIFEDAVYSSFEEYDDNMSDSDIDNKYLHDKMLVYIDKIKFTMPIQKEMFLEVSGIKKNFKWKSLEEYGEIIGYTKQNISKTYNKYLKVLSGIISQDEKVKEEFGQFL